MESTYLAPNKAGMCLVLVDNFSEQPVEVRVLCEHWMSNLAKLENTSELGSGQCPPAPPPDQLEIRNIDTDQLTS